MAKPESGSTAFLVKLASTLKVAGFDAKVNYQSLQIGEVKFPAVDESDQKDHVRVKFLDSSFKVTGTDDAPVFDITRAVGLAIGQLPKLLEHHSEKARVDANVKVARKLAGEDFDVFTSDRWEKWYGSQELMFGGRQNGIHIVVVVPDEAAALAVVAKLKS